MDNTLAPSPQAVFVRAARQAPLNLQPELLWWVLIMLQSTPGVAAAAAAEPMFTAMPLKK